MLCEPKQNQLGVEESDLKLKIRSALNPGGEVELEAQENSKISQLKQEAGKALGIPDDELRAARLLYEGAHLAENALLKDTGITEGAEIKLVPGNVGKGCWNAGSRHIPPQIRERKVSSSITAASLKTAKSCIFAIMSEIT